MSSGVTHLYGNLIFGTAITGTVLWLQPDLAASVFIGAVAGMIITPDLDINHETITEQIMNQVPFLGWLFGQAWYGYALIANHRGLSHNLFLGTLGRVAWTLLISLVTLIFLFGLLQLIGISFDPIAVMRGLTLVLLNPVTLLAWFAQDVLHYILDI